MEGARAPAVWQRVHCVLVGVRRAIVTLTHTCTNNISCLALSLPEFDGHGQTRIDNDVKIDQLEVFHSFPWPFGCLGNLTSCLS